MIYPVTLDLTILKNSTYQKFFTALKSGFTVQFDSALGTVISECHGLVAGDKIAFASTSGRLPCGLAPDAVYYVISTGLTAGQFKISATLNGTALAFTARTTDATAVFYAGKILDLSAYAIDADIRSEYEGSLIATFTPTIVAPADGKFKIMLTKTQTSLLNAGTYKWDLNLYTAYESFFWAKGSVTIESTVSRAS